ncbi:INO80 complex subunit B [Drosophila guanche]|uniref:Blast:INO80 complex subunit B n=1 Tax=Drosophila guanche TaxID=7266 RepID=A0A3B0J345_DROGU|nr:INO80 complex subunit B [Drosophila guanche]SPP75984.1 blast:INO80 complex subunit B [Drosophila guanche]
MGKVEDRRSKRAKRQKPARFASPTESSLASPATNIEPTPTPCQDTLKSLPLLENSAKREAQTRNVNIQFVNIRTRPASTRKPAQASTSPSNAMKKIKRRRNSDTSSDEERWLNAIETGKLDDVDEELKKIKDPKLMTARQRAMYERTQDSDTNMIGFVEELIALPSGYKEKEKPQTAEEIEKAALKSQKRKQQADERREKDKQKTMDRLLKKQESSKQRSGARSKQAQKPSHPKLTYMNTIEGAYILLPPGHEFPMEAKVSRPSPPAHFCYISDCGNRKAYSCSKTNVPLCSLVCYRKHITATILQQNNPNRIV